MSLPDYQREYECQFTEAVDGIFPAKLIAACTIPDSEAIDWPGLFKFTTYLGVDFARFGEDDNVIAYAHWNPEELKIYVRVDVIPGKGTRTTRICETIQKMCVRHSSIRKVVTDEGGVGAGATDALVQLLGSWRVEGIMNQKRTDEVEGVAGKYLKVDLYTTLMRLMEHDMIRLACDKRIAKSLRSMKYSYGKNNVLNVHGRDNHISEAIVRAVFRLKNVTRQAAVKMVFMPSNEPFIPAGTVDETWVTLRSS
jgi:hypothetical protein